MANQKTQKKEKSNKGSDKKKTKARISMYFGILINLLILIFFVEIFSFAYSFSREIFSNPVYKPEDETKVTVIIEPNSSFYDIAKTLEKDGVIKSKYVAMIRGKLSGASSSVLPGTYELSPSMSMDDIYAELSRTSEDDEE